MSLTGCQLPGARDVGGGAQALGAEGRDAPSVEGGGESGQEAGDRMEALAACCLLGLGKALSKGGARAGEEGEGLVQERLRGPGVNVVLER